MSEEVVVILPDGTTGFSTVSTTAFDDWRAAVVLSGEFDLANSHHIGAEIDRHIDAGRCVIRVDAGEVAFMDSTAIGELITASERCRRGHGSLILTNVPRRLHRLLQLAGLDQMLLVDSASAEVNGTLHSTAASA